MLMGWCSKPDTDGPLGPGNGMGLHQLLDSVLPEDPGVHSLRGARCGHRQLAHLLGLQAAGLTLSEAWTLGHAPEYRTGVRVFSSPVVSWDSNYCSSRRVLMAEVRTQPEAKCPIRPGDPCSLCVPGASGPQDCGLVYLVMSDPDLRDRLRQIRTASV